MKASNLKIARTVLFAGALGVMSMIFLIYTKPSPAASFPDKSSTPCKASVPEPYPFMGILALGILGGGYLLKQRLRKKSDGLNNKGLVAINDCSTSDNQQLRQISFIPSGEQSEENTHYLSPVLELQLIDPTERV